MVGVYPYAIAQAAVRLSSTPCPTSRQFRTDAGDAEIVEPWSLPIVARKGPLIFGPEQVRDMAEQYRNLRKELKRIGSSFWYRAGHKLGLF